MSGAEIGLAASVFLACTVEAVEALTIVLAVGTTRSWSSAMSGVGAATLALAVIVAALGPAFWGAEGAGASWPGGDAALLALIPGVLIAANAIVWVLGRAIPLAAGENAAPVDASELTGVSA